MEKNLKKVYKNELLCCTPEMLVNYTLIKKKKEKRKVQESVKLRGWNWASCPLAEDR